MDLRLPFGLPKQLFESLGLGRSKTRRSTVLPGNLNPAASERQIGRLDSFIGCRKAEIGVFVVGRKKSLLAKLGVFDSLRSSRS